MAVRHGHSNHTPVITDVLQKGAANKDRITARGCSSPSCLLLACRATLSLQSSNSRPRAPKLSVSCARFQLQTIIRYKSRRQPTSFLSSLRSLGRGRLGANGEEKEERCEILGSLVRGEGDVTFVKTWLVVHSEGGQYKQQEHEKKGRERPPKAEWLMRMLSLVGRDDVGGQGSICKADYTVGARPRTVEELL